ncbi:DNA replication factor RFC1 [uncultured virus]|nr:DNA replication factor RFC1 [uncultured virus]
MNKNLPWVEKFKPKKINEFICNKTAVKNIEIWLNKFDKIKNEKKKNNKNNTVDKKKLLMKSCLLVTGNHGVGKSVVIETVLKEYNYEIQTIDFSSIKSSKCIKDCLHKIVNSSNVINMIYGKKQKKIAIVVDELESITSTTEKNSIVILQKINDLNWFCPIIFISNNQHNKLLAEIKKNALEIKLFTPFLSDIKELLFQIVRSENIKIKNERVIDKLINHSQYDIRRLIGILEDIKNIFENAIITVELIDEYCQMSKKKDIDIDLFKATEGLLYNYKSVDECLRYFETEKVLLPLMVHHNYAKHILTNVDNIDKRYQIAQKVSDSLSTGDVIENYIYGDQNWDMQEIHGFYTCAITSFYLCDNIKNPQKIPLTFTTDLNKTSIKKINKKNITNTGRCFNNMTIFDYIYINKIIRKLINNGQIKECVDLLKYYNIKLEHIESLLKIDKIKNTKTSLTSKQKKEFSKFLNI